MAARPIAAGAWWLSPASRAPSVFFAALRAHGWDVAREIVFRDHHWFSRRDLAAIERAALDEAGLVMTTEKDAMRLDGAAVASSAVGWAFLPQHVDIEPPLSFASWIRERLSAVRDVPRQRTADRPDKGGEAA